MIYLDNAATTAICTEARQAMLPYLKEKYANPSGAYQLAKVGKEVIENSRRQIADFLYTKPEKIFFTSGGTESDNWALRTVLDTEHKCVGMYYKKPHIITTKIEHHAILNTCKAMEKEGVEVTYLDVDKWGMVNPYVLEREIRKNTRLISVMYANNEIGTIEPISEIGKIAKAYEIPFHTDAVQAFGHVPINLQSLNVDMLSASSHKFNGAKGVGFLYVKNPYMVKPFIYG